MTALSVTSNNNFMVSPTTLTEAMDFAKMIANSSLCPPTFKGKSGDVIIAMQMGAEVGLSPMQALQNIAVINGRPCLWGDAALAVVQASSQYVSHNEWFEGSEKEGNLTAFCSITRRGQEEYIKTFSQKDAEKAGLWKKAGVWQQYPNRMLQMRARAFAIRDKFADSLRGIKVAEEIGDYQVVDIKSERLKSKPVHVIKNQPMIAIEQETSDDIAIQFVELRGSIENCENEESLREIFNQIKKTDFKERQDLFKQLIDLKDQKKLEFSKKISDEYFGEENIDNETGEIKDA